MELLHEYDRPTLLRVARMSDSGRYGRRVDYSGSYSVNDFWIEDQRTYGGTIWGSLGIEFSVGSYTAVLVLEDYMTHLNYELDMGTDPYNAPKVALQWSLNNSDIKVDCTCADFQYRYAYWATQMDYKYGRPENRSSDQTNPDNKGRACKHLIAVLNRPSGFTQSVSDRILTMIKNTPTYKELYFDPLHGPGR